jgi:hypothetical protein
MRNYIVTLIVFMASFVVYSAPTTVYELAPNSPFTTPILSSNISMQCIVNYPTAENHSVYIYLYSGRAEINGNTLNKGHSLVLTPTNNQIIPISFIKGSQAEFTNLGKYALKATCG